MCVCVNSDSPKESERTTIHENCSLMVRWNPEPIHFREAMEQYIYMYITYIYIYIDVGIYIYVYIYICIYIYMYISICRMNCHCEL